MSTRQPATLTSLPAELLILVSDELRSYEIGYLRLTCKAIDAALADAARRSAFRAVSLVVSQTGLDTLAAIARSPVAPYVRHVVVACHIVQLGRRGVVRPARAAQFVLLGMDPSAASSLARFGTLGFHAPFERGDIPPPGADTPFARHLGAVLAALPALERASVGPGDVPKPRLADHWVSRHRTVEPMMTYRMPYGFRQLRADVEGDRPEDPIDLNEGGDVEHDGKEHVINGIFRGLLFALAHAYAERGATATALTIDEYKHGMSLPRSNPVGLDDKAFSLTPDEQGLAVPFLGSLKTLLLRLMPYTHEVLWIERYDALHAFLRLCTSLVDLSVEGVQMFRGAENAIVRLVANPPPLPQLEVLKISGYMLSPAVLIKVLTQWRLREVNLAGIELGEDATLVCGKTSTGLPMLWDAVLRAASQGGKTTAQRLQLDGLVQLHDDHNNADDEGIDEPGPRYAFVYFECGNVGEVSAGIITAASRTVTYPRVVGFGKDLSTEGGEGDVFLRAVSVLKDPAFSVFDAGDSDSEVWDDMDAEDGWDDDDGDEWDGDDDLDDPSADGGGGDDGDA
ncbi:hypothetical protein Q8F55_008497 [Vanrija albida]|uniref:F-box domain-containing protein n=1 Tax=Vanrija albida TaxID=181172 RepID=A0ABR3PQZ8_9TREE